MFKPVLDWGCLHYTFENYEAKSLFPFGAVEVRLNYLEGRFTSAHETINLGGEFSNFVERDEEKLKVIEDFLGVER